MKNTMKLLIAAVIALVLGLFVYTYYNNDSSYGIRQELGYQGFANESQLNSLLNLLKYSGIVHKDKKLQEVFPTKQDLNSLVDNLVKLTEQTQQKFVNRAKDIERWEVQHQAWMSENQEQILKELDNLGFVREIKPTVKKVDAICIFGATKPTMIERMKYVLSLVEDGFKVDNLIILLGERYLSDKVDGTADELAQLASKLGKNVNQLTEVNLAVDLYESSGLGQLNFNKYIIDTPGSALKRPNTYTTLLELAKWLRKPNSPTIKTILFISSQPYVPYQKAVINNVINSKNLKIKFEVAGPKAKDGIKNQQIIDALGSYIFANTMGVFNKIDLKALSPETQSSFKQIYESTNFVK